LRLLSCFLLFDLFRIVFASTSEKITSLPMCEDGAKVLLTNLDSPRKRGPKETPSGNLYSFAHQAYWGFKFLAEKKVSLWQQVLKATTPAQIQKVGRICSAPGAMPKAGYGAIGMMEYLRKKNVALQVLAAKQHRRYPSSDRPTSKDGRMVFLAIAVAAGIWELEFSTALRKLDQAGLGQRYMSREVHAGERLEEIAKAHSMVFAEPVGNYFYYRNGEYEQIRDLPCKIPKNWQGGFIIYGYRTNKLESAFSRTLPVELAESLAQSLKKPRLAARITNTLPLGKDIKSNCVTCRCGASICAQTRKLALQALAEHRRVVHGNESRLNTN
jgi:hypothetical protein